MRIRTFFRPPVSHRPVSHRPPPPIPERRASRRACPRRRRARYASPAPPRRPPPPPPFAPRPPASVGTPRAFEAPLRVPSASLSARASSCPTPRWRTAWSAEGGGGARPDAWCPRPACDAPAPPPAPRGSAGGVRTSRGARAAHERTRRGARRVGHPPPGRSSTPPCGRWGVPRVPRVPRVPTPTTTTSRR